MLSFGAIVNIHFTFNTRYWQQQYRNKWGGQGGGSPGEQVAGGVRETGEERAGGGIPTMAGSGREIQKGSQRNEPNNVS